MVLARYLGCFNQLDNLICHRYHCCFTTPYIMGRNIWSTFRAVVVASIVSSSCTETSALLTLLQITSSRAGIILEQRQSAVSAWTYYGCQTEATSSRALASKATAYDTMTLESCASDCAGYIYFGVEYGRECRHPSLIFASDTDVFPQVIAEIASQLGR